ncbi:ABC transporter ATP-binding protein [Desulfonema magnum]|uniref:Glutathione import ATP-binding protein n=1 Tax=Desulfonema magnum TaxID=45655 RepID=A0A975GT32_9BACT|nr:ABC transporter ATP-binding protein [Desulfonema magnum]QTA92666.1 Glutathione import ATP-binding protein [Desulfonema magnum]
MSEVILKIKNLVTAFDTESGRIRAVDDVSFEVKQGQTLGIVGESGCGKSVTSLSIMRLLPKPAGIIESGEILFQDKDIVRTDPDKMHKIRGNRISMIFQEPMTALNPVHKIGKQIGEVFRLHYSEMNKKEIQEKSLEMLHKVGIPDPEKRMGEYPHQISGGMRQRVMIAMALACEPDILIADEPTTALDVTIQAQILELMKQLQRDIGMTIIFITHDLGVIAEMCDEVVVMYAGKVAETASVSDLFKNPSHPYTKGLLSSMPRLEYPRKMKLNVIKGMVPSLYELPRGCRFQNRCPYFQAVCETEPPMKSVGENHFSCCHFENLKLETRNSKLETRNSKFETRNSDQISSFKLQVSNLKMHFPVYGGVFWRKIGKVYAVDGVSFNVRTGETLGLVGESGCGKTTVGRAILRIYDPTEGDVLFEGKNMSLLGRKALRDLRRDMQMIFQDPFESLNSRHTIGDILEEPFIIHGVGSPEERKSKVRQLLNRVGISQDAVTRFPHEFSGGQRQRIGIARAIALDPKLMICDEPVSALDVSVQSQILNLLLELQQDMGLTYVFIAHDLAVVKHISDHIAVMYLGKIVEYADADTIYEKAMHPYTQTLISAIPVPDPSVKKQTRILAGDVPSPINPPSGCRFHTRCPIMTEQCKHEEPKLRIAPGSVGEGHLVACHRAGEVKSEK